MSTSKLFGILVIAAWTIHGAVVLGSATTLKRIGELSVEVLFYSVLHVVIAMAGVVAGMLILQGRLLGYALATAGALPYLLVVEWRWYQLFMPGAIYGGQVNYLVHLEPGLGYRYIVMPVLSMIIAAISTVVLVRTATRAKP